MTKSENVSVFALRVALGWMFFYAGITKIMDPNWSAAGYLQSAKTFTDFYAWLAKPVMLPIVNFVNEWGLTILGIALILGVFIRLGSILGSVLMLLYYFPVLTFPRVGHYFLIDDHIIFAVALFVLSSAKAGEVWGLGPWCASLPLCKRYPILRSWVA